MTTRNPIEFTDGTKRVGNQVIITETDVTAVNRLTALSSPDGNITPNLGDVVIKYEHVSGAAIAELFTFYHNTE